MFGEVIHEVCAAGCDRPEVEMQVRWAQKACLRGSRVLPIASVLLECSPCCIDAGSQSGRRHGVNTWP